MTESSTGHDTNQVPKVNLEGTGGSERDQGSSFGDFQGCLGCRDPYIENKNQEAREE
ncbi:hypothetical protein Tco_1248155, partial [Tanacetum coccineum]